VEPRSAHYIYEKIGSPVKHLKWYNKSSHIITLDREREQLFADVDAFIQEVDKSISTRERGKGF
jgi:carboxylesterase